MKRPPDVPLPRRHFRRDLALSAAGAFGSGALAVPSACRRREGGLRHLSPSIALVKLVQDDDFAGLAAQTVFFALEDAG